MLEQGESISIADPTYPPLTPPSPAHFPPTSSSSIAAMQNTLKMYQDAEKNLAKANKVPMFVTFPPSAPGPPPLPCCSTPCSLHLHL